MADKSKTTKKHKPARKRRIVVGHRSADTGRFVDAEFADNHPSETVAVTKAQPTAEEALEEYMEAVEREAEENE